MKARLGVQGDEAESGALSRFDGLGDDRRILLVGARGFIGSSIAKLLNSLRWTTTHLIRQGAPIDGRHSTMYGDLTDLESLRRACAGHDVVINAASYVGSNAQTQSSVNSRGASNLARAATGAGVSRLVYVSSTSVYGGTLANGSAERRLGLAPRSTLSLSRVAAEATVLQHDGVVLRPHLVYGPRDRFFLGPLLLALHALSGTIENGSAVVSTISAESLARLVVASATTLPPVTGGRVFHAAHPTTSSVSQLVASAFAGWPVPEASFSADQAFEKLAGVGIKRSQFDMISKDNWFDSNQAWRTLDLNPGPSMDFSEESLAWYKSILQGLEMRS